mmetsp:Transcript_90513/g.251613  ORF Transcript_90513/g.251613 Transcript_90513/m.251613 type:complete len:208 (-) Transcript_90513:164-787(-)
MLGWSRLCWMDTSISSCSASETFASSMDLIARTAPVDLSTPLYTRPKEPWPSGFWSIVYISPRLRGFSLVNMWGKRRELRRLLSLGCRAGGGCTGGLAAAGGSGSGAVRAAASWACRAAIRAANCGARPCTAEETCSTTAFNRRTSSPQLRIASSAWSCVLPQISVLQRSSSGGRRFPREPTAWVLCLWSRRTMSVCWPGEACRSPQ